MFISTVVDLREERSWEPGHLTMSELHWPSSDDWALVPLSDVCMTITPDSWAAKGTPVITPAGIDDATGSLRRRSRNYHGPVFQVQPVGEGARPGDLLIPPSSAAVFLVRPEHVGSVISQRFAVLRPAPGRAIWIWAVLNSTDGRLHRAHLAATGHDSSRAPVLLDLCIPWPPEAELRELESDLWNLESHTHLPEEEAAETWWRLTDLRDVEWRFALATPNPEILDVGIPLGESAEEIVRGRMIPGDLRTEDPRQGVLPVSDIGVLSGKAVRHWLTTPETNLPMAHPGDVLVAGAGNRPYATVADYTSVVDSNVLRVRLREPERARALTHYLNGPAGYAMRQIFVLGSVIPSLSVADLRRLPVPPEVLDAERESDEPPASLALQLERVLWR